jgi:antitoxin component YwqK of YwqJK toxin-antitoxin module
MEMHMITKLCVMALFGSAAFAFDETVPTGSPNDDLRRLTIPDDAEEVPAKWEPFGDVAQRFQCLVNGKVVGERLYYDNGRLADEKPFRDKGLHGLWRQFHQNGKPFAERPYRDGQPDGKFRFWDETGELLGQSELKRGSGILNEYPKPQLGSHREEIPYVNGKIHGKRKCWARFDITGPQGYNVTTYDNGVTDGWTYTLHDEGTLLEYGYFKNGRIHGVVRKATRDGKTVDGYPSYMIDGMEVSEAQFREAAKTDEILALTLTGKPDVEESEHLQKPTKPGGK